MSSASADAATPVLILVPAIDASGPVRGAVALANGLAEGFAVTLLALKPSRGSAARLDPRVRVVHLYESGGWPARIAALRRLVGRPAARPVSISYCLHGDVANWTLRGRARIVSSVRANMPQNYRYDFGLLGWPLAAAHLLMLRRFDVVVAMTGAMEAQLRRWGIRRVVRIGNFIDEAALPVAERPPVPDEAPVRLIYVGSLSARKRIDLLLRALVAVRGDGLAVTLDLVGDGPLRGDLERQVSRFGLQDVVRFHGQVADPVPVVRESDFLVLPSESEGVSRAMLEALHVGVPCVVRDVDGNAEVIRPGETGYLFRDDDDLPAVLGAAVRERSRFASRGSLLPDWLRQAAAVDAYAALVTP